MERGDQKKYYFRNTGVKLLSTTWEISAIWLAYGSPTFENYKTFVGSSINK